MNRILQIAIGTTIGILAAILIIVGAGAAWRAYQVAKVRAAQAMQDARDRVENEKNRVEDEKLSKAARINQCKAWIGTSLPIAEACKVITDATRFNSPGEKAASFKQCLVDAQACRDLMVEHDAAAR
jgi:predicted negative regulator of RcsB-dependent stress response